MAKKQQTIQDKYELTVKQHLFLQAYMANGFNGTKAALQAYDCANDDRASSQASSTLRIPKIKKALKEMLDNYIDVHGMNNFNVLKELTVMATSDITDFIEISDDKIIKLTDWNDLGIKTKAIKEIKIIPKTLYDIEGRPIGKEEQEIHLKLHGKEKSLELMGKAQGLFDKDININLDNLNFTITADGYEEDDEPET